MREKNNIPADIGHFLRTEIDSTDSGNENLKIKKKQGRKNHLKIYIYIFQKILKQTKASKKIKYNYLKNIRQRNKSNKVAKSCWLSRYKRSR